MIILATDPARHADCAAINFFHRNDWRHVLLPLFTDTLYCHANYALL
jgi:hypothetical protein